MGLQFAKALEPYGLYFLEEPCWPESVDGLAMINRAVSTPIATGERVTNLAAFRDLFNARACEVCQVDITHCGGFSEARRIAALAEAHRIALAPHNPQGPVSTAASLEFGFSQPSYVDLRNGSRRCAVACGRGAGRLHRRAEGAHRAAEHAAGPGHHDQRGRGEEAPVPAGTAAARVLLGWQRGGLVSEACRKTELPTSALTRRIRRQRYGRFRRRECPEAEGVLAIAHTPFTESTRSTRPPATVDWAFAVGADGIGTGMVSETFKLTHDERLSLRDDARRVRGGPRAGVRRGRGGEHEAVARLRGRGGEGRVRRGDGRAAAHRRG